MNRSELQYAIEHVLADHDIVGMIATSALRDEYSGEAREIATRIKAGTNLLLIWIVVYNVHRERMGFDVAGLPTKYLRLAKEIHRLVR